MGTQFIRYSHSGTFAAASNATDGTVTIYSANSADGSLNAIQTVTSGTEAISLSYSPSDSFAVVTNFGDIANSIESSITVYKVHKKTGKWHLIQTLSTSTNPEILDPLSIAYSPDEKFVAVSNTGTGNGDDTIAIYAVDSSGQLSLVHAYSSSELDVTGSAWILHYSPDGKFLACDFHPTSGNATVVIFPVNQTTGELDIPTGIGTVRQLPFGVTFSHDGKLLTVTNTTPPSISVFMIDQTGALTEVADSPFSTGEAGSGPRFLAFSKDDTIAAVTNIHAATIPLFHVDHTTGFFTQDQVVTLPSGSQPRGIDFDPNGKFAAAALAENNAVAVYSVGKSTLP
jgi:6-phosphogluconolactonase